MNKNTRNAVIAAVVLVALLGTYLGIAKKNPKEDTANQSEDILIDKKETEITQLKMTQNSTQESYLLKKAQDGSWFAGGQEEKEINKPSVEEILQAGIYLQAEQTISKKTDNLQEFGLDKGATAEITYSDGSVIKIHIGDKTPDGSGYYAMLDGGDKVYMIATKYGAALSYEFSDVRERYTHLINPEELEYISIQQKDKDELIIEPNPVKSLTTEYGYGTYVLTKGYQEPKTVLSDALRKMVIKPATSIIIKEFVEDNVMDYSKYGLDNPQARLYIRDKLKNEIDLLIGKEDGKGNIYIRYADENSVYAVEKNVVEPILEVTRYYLIDKYVDLVNIDDIDKVEVQANDIYTEITMERYMDTVGEEKKEVEKTIYKVDSVEVDVSDYKDFFAALIGVHVDAEIGDEQVGTTPVLTTKVTMRDGRVTEVNYLEYDETFYAVDRNGTIELIANKKNVESLIEARDLLLTKKKTNEQ